MREMQSRLLIRTSPSFFVLYSPSHPLRVNRPPPLPPQMSRVLCCFSRLCFKDASLPSQAYRSHLSSSPRRPGQASKFEGKAAKGEGGGGGREGMPRADFAKMMRGRFVILLPPASLVLHPHDFVNKRGEKRSRTRFPISSPK